MEIRVLADWPHQYLVSPVTRNAMRHNIKAV